jgi:hypothetical protein
MIDEVVVSLLPGQRQMIDMPRRDVDMDICLYQGGFGSGKTKGGVELGLMLAEKYQGVRGLVAGMTWPLIRDATLAEYFEIFDDRDWYEGRDYIWQSSKKKLLFPKWGNSEILFRGLDKPGKLKSLNLGWVHFEEMSESDEASFTMLMSRLRHKKMPRKRLFGTSNPPPNKGWMHEYFGPPHLSEGKLRGAGLLEETVDAQQVRINYRKIIAPTTQNVHLDAAYMLNMRTKFDPEYYRMNVLGEDGDYNSGRVCKGWSSSNVQDIQYIPERRIYLSCDFNVDPMAWEIAHVLVVNGVREYHFFDEIVVENTCIDDCVDIFAERYGNHKAGIIITGDASGNNRIARRIDVASNVAQTTYYKLLENAMRRNGITNFERDIRSCNPLVESRIAAWNAMICNADGVRRVKVDPKCKWLIHCCENLMYKPGSTMIKLPTDKQIEANPKLKFLRDPWVAASYLVERYDPIQLDEVPERRAKSKLVQVPFQPGR